MCGAGDSRAGSLRLHVPYFDGLPLNLRLKRHDVFGQSQTTGGQVRYIVEGTATNAAAGVAEAGLKPESTLGLSEVVEPVRKIATVLPVSDELLEDAPSIQGHGPRSRRWVRFDRTPDHEL